MRPDKARALTGFNPKKGEGQMSFYEFLAISLQAMSLAFTVWAWFHENDDHNGKDG